MALTKYKLGDLITQRREKYDGSDIPIRGVSREGFITPKQDNADLKLYNLFYMDDFVFNPARMEINSIAYNCFFEKATCSSLYEVFYVTDTSVLLPAYLNLFVKRDEFARRCEFIGWGSAREYCRVANISEIEIELPSVEIQQKFVDVYKAMVANQKCYENGLSDLKLTCDANIENLRREMPCEKIGPYIQQSDRRNDIGLTQDDVRGISIEKKFIFTKADMTGVNVANYKVVEPDAISFVTVTSRNGEKITIALNNSDDFYLVSGTYEVFTVMDKTKLLPAYLAMFFNRAEFDRYSRFHSWGSARETFNWDDMQNVKIPIPDIHVQQAIVNIYKCYLKRKEINERLKAQIKDLCPILIRGSLQEGGKTP